ncbi:MAG: histidine phosphatase family protein [Atopobiaceae bacterium]|nr:histidine phosphatase family protein [Atopobiaceae bacterium]
MMLYVVRHGQTDANVNHLWNGINDGDLTDFGVEQARIAASRLESTHIDRIVASPLVRTLHTADILNIAGLPIRTDERLLDRDYGELTLKPSKTLTQDERPLLYEHGAGSIKGIESWDSLFDRVRDFVEDMRRRHSQEDILVVTHGDCARAIQELLTGETENYQQTAEVRSFEL